VSGGTGLLSAALLFFGMAKMQAKSRTDWFHVIGALLIYDTVALVDGEEVDLRFDDVEKMR